MMDSTPSTTEGVSAEAFGSGKCQLLGFRWRMSCDQKE